MPKIKFKLKDPNYCNGCIYSRYTEEGIFECDKNIFEMFYIPIDKKISRPKKCIDKFGELEYEKNIT